MTTAYRFTPPRPALRSTFSSPSRSHAAVAFWTARSDRFVFAHRAALLIHAPVPSGLLQASAIASMTSRSAFLEREFVNTQPTTSIANSDLPDGQTLTRTEPVERDVVSRYAITNASHTPGSLKATTQVRDIGSRGQACDNANRAPVHTHGRGDL